MLMILDDMRREKTKIFNDLVKNESIKKYINYLADMLYSLPTERLSNTESIKLINQIINA